MSQATTHGNSYGILETVTSNGTWMHAPGEEFIFAFKPSTMSSADAAALTNGFKLAQTIPNMVKTTAENKYGKGKIDGTVYLLDQNEMITTLNTINGMAETNGEQIHESGSKTVVDINMEFFMSVLAGNEEVAPMIQFLQQKMSSVKASLEQHQENKVFGLMIIQVGTFLGEATTTVKYCFSDQKTSSWIVHTPCGSSSHYSYDYNYTAVSYSYYPTSQSKKILKAKASYLLQPTPNVDESHLNLMNLMVKKPILSFVQPFVESFNNNLLNIYDSKIIYHSSNNVNGGVEYSACIRYEYGLSDDDVVVSPPFVTIYFCKLFIDSSSNEMRMITLENIVDSNDGSGNNGNEIDILNNDCDNEFIEWLCKFTVQSLNDNYQLTKLSYDEIIDAKRSFVNNGFNYHIHFTAKLPLPPTVFKPLTINAIIYESKINHSIYRIVSASIDGQQII